MECSNNTLNPPKGCACGNDLQNIKAIILQGNKYYVDGKYWGEIIEKTANYFKVECNNGNKYMKGQIIKVNISLNNII